MTDRLIPDPRPEVVELFEDVLMCKAEDPEAQALFDSRFWWTTRSCCTARRAGLSRSVARSSETSRSGNSPRRRRAPCG